jgi:hypothetical protein
MKVASVVCAMGLASGVNAQPLEFVIDPAQSTIDLTIELDLGALGGDTDSDSSALSGVIEASFDDNASPTESSLHDFFAAMDSNLNFNWVPAFLSTADATLTGGFVEYANPGVMLGPVAMTGSDLVFPSVPTIVGGVLTVNYNIFLFGSGSEVVDLSTLGVTNNDIAGTVVPGDGIVTVTNTVPIDATQPLEVDGAVIGDVIVTGTATMVAVAQVPDCVADFTGDGVLDFFDVSAFLSAFAAQDPSADMTNDGAWDFFDVSAFLAAFGAGCP